MQPILDVGPNRVCSPFSFFLGIFPRWPSSWPTLAQAGPPRAFPFPRNTQATATHSAAPPHTWMELNRSDARLPSLSHTSSAPHQLPSLIQCQNR
jgi:hypothetical protein